MGILDILKNSDMLSQSEEGRLKELVKQANMSNPNMNVANIQYSLPFTGIGSEHGGQDFTARQAGEDSYEVRVNDPFSPFGGNMNLTSNGMLIPTGTGAGYCQHMVDAATMRRIIDGEHLPHLGLHRMSDKEKDELKGLEAELNKWKRLEKLRKFKSLPSHIRQAIVDEAILKDLMGDMDEGVDENKFPDYDRVKDLRSKQKPNFLRNAQFRGHNVNIHDHQHMFKYGFILEKFTTDELMEAHAEASLEDEIAD